MSLSDKAPLYETERYAVVLAKMIDPNWKDELGYILYNKETGVREGETNVETVAIRTMREMQQSYESLMAGEDVEVVDDFDKFLQEMMEKDKAN